MKSLGKMRFKLSEEDYSKCIHSMYLSRNEFSLMELVNVIWGITRMGYPSRSVSEVNQEVDELFRIVEGI